MRGKLTVGPENVERLERVEEHVDVGKESCELAVKRRGARSSVHGFVVDGPAQSARTMVGFFTRPPACWETIRKRHSHTIPEYTPPSVEVDGGPLRLAHHADFIAVAEQCGVPGKLTQLVPTITCASEAVRSCRLRPICHSHS